jgi:NADPH:quinone reductase
MKAILLRETGGPNQLEYTDVAEPAAQDGQALVRVRAAGINFLDLLVRQGRYPQAPPLPTVPGSEIAGEVGGRRVIGLPRGAGGYAELAAVDEQWLAPLPDGASFEEGASFLMTFLTAWLSLTGRARVEPGGTVLVHAAAGGVGSAAVQVARHLGARVTATASTEEKREFARSLGAEEAYGYDEFADRVRADVVVDPVGGEVLVHSLRTLDPGGVLVAAGFAGGAWPELDPALLVGRNVGVIGFYLGRLMSLRPDVVRTAIDELLRLWRERAFRPVVGAVFPLAEAAEAHRLIEERRHTGKVVLVP